MAREDEISEMFLHVFEQVQEWLDVFVAVLNISSLFVF